MVGGDKIKLLKTFIKLIETEIEVLNKRLELYDKTQLRCSERERWNLETGEKFNELISNYPISEDELLRMSKVLCDFVMLTRITDIEQYFFVEKDRDKPRLPFMIKDSY